MYICDIRMNVRATETEMTHQHCCSHLYYYRRHHYINNYYIVERNLMICISFFFDLSVELRIKMLNQWRLSLMTCHDVRKKQHDT